MVFWFSLALLEIKNKCFHRDVHHLFGYGAFSEIEDYENNNEELNTAIIPL